MLNLNLEKALNIKCMPQLMLTLGMQQALHVLQLPIVELSEWLKGQIEENPLLDYVDEEKDEDEASPELDFKNLDELDDFYRRNFFSESKDFVQIQQEKARRNHEESLIRSPIFLFEYLMTQAKEAFEDFEDLQLAEWIIGHLDERGFLSTPEAELMMNFEPAHFKGVLDKIRTFDPPGIAASSLQKSLLKQLDLKGGKGSLTWLMCEDYFEDFLHYRLSVLKKNLKCSHEELTEIFKEISYLDFHPGYRFRDAPTHVIIPDVILRKEGSWIIEINEELLPKFGLSKIAEGSCQSFVKKEDRAFFNHFLYLGKGLQQSIARRGETLKKLMHFLIEKHLGFFNGETRQLCPLTMQEVAENLGLHESTIARTVGGKYLFCPQGMFKLRYFFNRAMSSNDQGPSNQALQDLLTQLVQEEDKEDPLSDICLSAKMQAKGFCCARRTITKYRKVLRIAPAAKRKKRKFFKTLAHQK